VRVPERVLELVLERVRVQELALVLALALVLVPELALVPHKPPPCCPLAPPP